jgi:putative flippase GtrA
MGKKDSWLYSFLRHQAASFLATLIDFGTLIFLTEVAGLWYVFSTSTGALMGTIANFILSSYWAFTGSKNSLKNQLYKYVLVYIGSLILNTLFVYLITDFLAVDYKLSKFVTAILIGWGYNFILMRLFVFKK